MTKNLLAVVLSLQLCGFAQTITMPSDAQCNGPDCDNTGSDSQERRKETTDSASQQQQQASPTGRVRLNERSNGRESQIIPPDLNLSNLPTMPEYTKTGFEKYVQATVGVELPIFGHEFFRNVPTTFAPVDHIPVPADYVVGPGDQLLIRAWGKIDVDVQVFVDRNGQVYIPRVGAIPVAGLRYDQLNGFLHSAIGRFFKDFDLDVNIGRLRSIQVFVLGFARRPGTYTISSLSTLANALFESGGPASNGSMRHVQLKRNNKVVTELDLYQLILNGDKSGDANLQSGDVIYIPRVGPLVAVSGSVYRPAIYELRSPALLGGVLDDTGGLTSIAGTARVSLDRVSDHKERLVDEFALNEEGLKHELKDGDIVKVYAVSPRIENAVTLRGNVAQPGRYLWHEGMRVSDLIPNRQVLITRQYWNERNNVVQGGKNDGFGVPKRRPNLRDRQSLPQDRQMRTEQGEEQPPQEEQRQQTQDNQQRERESTQSSQDMESEGQTRIGIKRDETFDRNARENSDENDADQDLASDIRRRATDINWEYAVIERTDNQDLTTQLIPFNLANAIDRPLSADNQILVAGDIVTVFSQKDIPVSVEARAKFVQVEGEVKSPGLYRVAAGETLRDVVKRAGGLSSHAYLFGAELHRESTLKVQKKQLAQMVERMQRELAEQSGNTAPSAVPEDRTEERLRTQEERNFIDRLARIQPTGRVVLELRPSDSTIDDVPTMALEDGDKFLIPAKMETVEVFGAVYNENAFRYKPHKLVKEYVSNAGGFTRGADKGREFVIRADGTVISRQHHRGFLTDKFETMRLMPGDAIVVPQRFRTTGLLRELNSWSQIFSQLALGAASINVLH